MMRLPLILVVALAVLILAVNGERSAAPGGVRDDAMTRVNLLLERMPGDAGKAARDPFYGELAPARASHDAPPAAARPALPATPAIPAFRIVGKQHDEHGWLVFIASPERNGPLWTVREGERFGEGYRVAKLAPPTLVIEAKESKQSRKFSIGTDDE